MQHLRDRRRWAASWPVGRWGLAGWLLVLAAAGSARAQENPAVELGPTGGRAGAGFLRPEAWGAVRGSVINRSDADIEPTLVLSFEAQPFVQYGSVVWMPAGSQRTIVQVLRTPDLKETKQGAEVRARLMAAEAGGGVPRSYDSEPGTVRVDDESRTLAVIADESSEDAAVLAQSLRVQATGSRRLASMSAGDVPMVPAVFEPVDALLLAHGDPGFSAVQLRTLRHWLIRGGRLWIMLDRTPAHVAAELLGNDWRVAVVDETWLPTVRIEGGRDPHEAQRERPFHFVRAAVDGGTVTHTVEGWPAAAVFEVGRGLVIVTTLEPQAWLGKGVDKNGIPKAGAAVVDIGEVLWRPVTGLQPPAQAADDFVHERIGFRVMDRGLVVVLLLVLPAWLAVGGWWLRRRGSGEWATLGGVAAAVVAAGVIFVAGGAHRMTVPLTMASLQFADAAPGQNAAAVDAVIGVYSPLSDEGPLRATRGGVVWPDTNAEQGKQLTMLWRDYDAWAWEGLELPEGSVRLARSMGVLDMPQPPAAVLRFDAGGVRGKLQGFDDATLEDAVLATPTATLALRAGDDGTIVAGPEDVLPGGVYLQGVTLGTQQQQRQRVYRALLDRGAYPAEPVVLGWRRALDLGLELSIPADLRDTALVAAPVRFEPAQPGERVSVPSAFVPFAVVRGPGGVGSTTFYDRANQSWIENISQASTLVLEFRPPAAAMPMKLESATLELDLAAADREVKIMGLRNGRLVEAVDASGIDGAREVTLEPIDLFQPDARGVVTVAVRIGDSPTMASTFRIHGVALRVAGTVTARNASPLPNPPPSQAPGPAQATAHE